MLNMSSIYIVECSYVSKHQYKITTDVHRILLYELIIRLVLPCFLRWASALSSSVSTLKMVYTHLVIKINPSMNMMKPMNQEKALFIFSFVSRETHPSSWIKFFIFFEKTASQLDSWSMGNGLNELLFLDGGGMHFLRLFFGVVGMAACKSIFISMIPISVIRPIWGT